MALFVVSYDLHNQRNYKPLHDALTENGGAKLLESLWLIKFDSTAAEVRDWLKSIVDNDDSVAVIQLKAGSQWASLRAQSAGSDWLKKNVLA